MRMGYWDSEWGLIKTLVFEKKGCPMVTRFLSFEMVLD